MYGFTKRVLDILIAVMALIFFLPLFVIIAIVQRLSVEGDVFYRQQRVGFKNKRFLILKFATMLRNSPNMGTGTITLKDDPRVTRIGKILRATKLNEIPQVVNVLKGDMSVVGPRPLDEAGFSKYSVDVQNSIYNSKPGITGIGSIVFRAEQDMISQSDACPHEFMKQVISPYKGALEIWYQDNASLRIDFLIILVTAWVIVFPKSRLYFKIFKDLPKPDQSINL